MAKGKKLVQELKKQGLNYSVFVSSGVVVMFGPGAPYNSFPTQFDEADFNEAISGGQLQKCEITIHGPGTHVTKFEAYMPVPE